jgi:hypothetical protein
LAGPSRAAGDDDEAAGGTSRGIREQQSSIPHVPSVQELKLVAMFAAEPLPLEDPLRRGFSAKIERKPRGSKDGNFHLDEIACRFGGDSNKPLAPRIVKLPTANGFHLQSISG